MQVTKYVLRFVGKTQGDSKDAYVALDSASGGYPYATTLDRAHDFKTPAAAAYYAGMFDSFELCTLTVTYEVHTLGGPIPKRVIL